MNRWKLVVLGGLAYYVATFIVGFATGPLIHNGVLKETYRANAQLWRPELNEDPPDMAALMPRWITTGVIGSFIVAAIFGWVRPAFSGPGWKRGLQYGVTLGLLGVVWALGYSGVFNAPDKIWIWWSLEGFLYYLPGGAVLGWLGGKLDPLPA
jgi:hypothetical protein